MLAADARASDGAEISASGAGTDRMDRVASRVEVASEHAKFRYKVWNALDSTMSEQRRRRQNKDHKRALPCLDVHTLLCAHKE